MNCLNNSIVFVRCMCSYLLVVLLHCSTYEQLYTRYTLGLGMERWIWDFMYFAARYEGHLLCRSLAIPLRQSDHFLQAHVGMFILLVLC